MLKSTAKIEYYRT